MVRNILLTVMMLMLASAANAATGLTYHGRIIKPNNQGLEGANVFFRIQIRSPGAENCLLFEEQQTLNMTGSKGIFVLTIGEGTRVAAAVDGGNTLAKVFSNRGTLSGAPNLTCSFGTTYSPGVADGRKLQVQFYDGSAWETLPPQAINYNPLAIESMQIAGYGKDQLVRVADGTTANELNATQWGVLWDVVNGNYAKTDGSNFAPNGAVNFNNNRATNLADPTAAQDAATRNYADTKIGGKNIDVSGVTNAAGDGHALVWDQTQNKWVTGVPNDTTKLPLAGGTMTGAINMNSQNITNAGHVQIVAQGTLYLGKFTTLQQNALVATPLVAADAGRTWFNTDTGKMMYWDGDSAEPVGSEAWVTSTVNSAISTAAANYLYKDGSVALTADWDIDGAGAGTRKITGLADPSAADGAATKAYVDAAVGGGGSTKFMTKDLPAVPGAGQDGQALRYNDTSGDWEFYSPTAGLVTSVGAGTGIDIGGTAADPTVVLEDTAVTTGSYGSATGVATFTVDQQGRLTAAGTTAIAITPDQVVNGAGKYFGYKPNNTACADGEVLKWDNGNSRWICSTAGSLISSSDVTTALGYTPVDIAGDTMTGLLVLSADPSAALGAATKQYVDSGISTASGLFIKKDGSVAYTGSQSMGGNTLYGNSTSGGDLLLESTSHATKGDIVLNPTSGNVGIGVAAPARVLDVSGPMRLAASALPGTPGTGDIAIDSGDSNKLKWYDGSGWQTVGSTAGTVGSVTAGVALSNSGTATAPVIDLDDTAVTPAAYGSASSVATFTVDQQGRLTAAASTTIDIKPDQISNGAGKYFSYKPNNSACADGEYLKWDNTNSRWACGAVTSGNVTTALGYTPVNKAGDTMTGLLVLSADPSAALGAATKQYVDAEITTAGGAFIKKDGSVAFTGSQSMGGNTIYGNSTSAGDLTLESSSHATKGDIILNPTSGNVGIGTTTPGRLLHVAGPMRLTAAALPGTPATGDIAVDSGDSNKLKWYDGSGWQTVGSTAGTVASVTAGTGIDIGGTATSPSVILEDTAVTPAAYGSATGVATFTVDQQGRLTAAGTTAIAITPDQVVNGAGKYFGYKPNNSACADGEYLKWDNTNSRWACGAVTSGNVTTALGYTPVNKAGDTMSGALAMGTNKITGLGDPTAAQDAATKNYVDGEITTASGLFIKKDGSVAYTGSQSMGGNTLYGNSTSGGDLLLESTSHATKGDIILNPTSGNVGIGVAAPARVLDVSGPIRVAASALPGTPGTGDIAIDSGDGNKLKWYNGSGWQTVGSTSGTVASVTGTAGQIAVGGTATDPVLSLVDTAVSAASYGSASQVATFTVDAKGRLTAAASTTIDIKPDQISNGAGKYFAYKPNNTACADNEILKWDNGNSRWICSTVASSLGYTPVNKAGDTMTGLLVLSADPSANLGAATKQYVDGAITTASGAFVKHDGSVALSADWDVDGAGAGTRKITGLADPSAADGAATKGYVDAAVGGGASTKFMTKDLPAVPGAGQTGQALRYNDTSGDWEFFAPSTGTVTSVTGGVGLTAGGTAADPVIDLDDTAVTPAAYGSASSVATFTVDQQGRLTAAASTTIDIKADQISNGAGKYFGYKPNNAACSDGQYLEWDNANSRWVCGSVSSSEVTTALGYTPVNKAGDTMSGALAMGTNKITGLGDPTAAQDAATKNYVDGEITTASGLFIKKDGSVALTADWDADGAGAGTRKITGLAVPTASDGAATKGYADANLVSKTLAVPAAGQDGQSIRWNQTAGNWEYYSPATGTGDFFKDGSVAMTDTLMLAQGVLGTGGISFNGDSNTGIYRTAADVIAIDTDGAERLRVSATGMRLAASALPGTPATGDIAVDSGDSNKLKWYNGSGWQTVSTSTGTVTSVTAGTGIDIGGTATAPSVVLEDTAVTPAAYGSASSVATFTVDQQGRLTAAASTTIDIKPDQISNGAGKYFGYKPNNSACADNEILKWDNGNSRWICATAGSLIASSDVTTALGYTPVNKAGDTMTGLLVLSADPSANLGAATKQYVDSAVSTAGGAYIKKDGTVAFTGSQSMGGNTLYGNSTSGGDLTLDSTSHATKGDVILAPSGGFVGVGTSAPAVLMEISRTDSQATLQVTQRDVDDLGGLHPKLILKHMSGGASDGIPALELTQNEDYDNNNLGELRFQINGNTMAAVMGGTSGAHTNQANRDTYLALMTGKNAATTEKVRIDSSGYMGIGTSTPARHLHSAGPIRVDATALPGTPGTGDIAVDSGDSNKLKWYNGSGWQTVGTGLGDALKADPLSQFAATTSAQLSGVLSDETGTGVAVFGTSPTFTTNITAPKILGGTAAAQSLTFQTTSGVGVAGADHIFLVGNNGATEAMRILNSGYVGIGTASPSVQLEVAGTIKASAFEGPLTSTSTSIGDGTAGSPSNMFTSDTDTGLFRPGANTIGFAGGGSHLFSMSSAGLVSPTTGGGSVTTAAGTAAAPTYSFAGDTDTGWFRPAADTLAAATGGTERMRITSGGVVQVGTAGSARGNIYVQADGTNGGYTAWFSPNGAFYDITANDAYLELRKFGSTGLVITNGNKVGIGTTSPSTELEVAGTIKATAFEGPLTSTSTSIGDGTAASPSNLFTADTDTGLFRPGANTIGFAGGGAELFSMSSAGLVSPTTGGGLVTTAAGTAAAPTFSFAGDTDTGWYRAAADTLAAATGGSERVRIDSNGRLGIGTTSPLKPLHVQASGDARMVFTDTSGAADNKSWTFGAVGEAFYGKTMNDANSSAITWLQVDRTGSTVDYVSLATGGGNVGIGTATAGEKLEVAGNIKINGSNGNNLIKFSGTSYLNLPGIQFNDTNTGAGGLYSHQYINAATESGLSLLYNAYQSGDSSTVNLKRVRTLWLPSKLTLDANGSLQFSNATAGAADSSITDMTQKFVINSAGNVGIGVSSPTKTLQVAGQTDIKSTSADDVDNQMLLLSRSRSDSTAPGSGFGGHMGFFLEGFTNDSSVKAALIGVKWDNAQTDDTTTRNSNLRFSTMAAGTLAERLRITPTGNVGIGNISPSYKLDVTGDINASGSVRAAGVALTSDSRFKKDIQPIQSALQKIINVRGVTYMWRMDEFPDRHFNDRQQLGVIAQEVEKQFPQAVDTDKHGYKSVNYPSLIAPVIEAIKELYATVTRQDQKVESVKREVASVKQENAELKKKNQDLEKKLDKLSKKLCAKDPDFCQ